MSESGPEDLGRPVEELTLLELDPERGFRYRLRTRLERRRLAGSAVDLALPAFGAVLRELLDMLFMRHRGGSR